MKPKYAPQEPPGHNCAGDVLKNHDDDGSWHRYRFRRSRSSESSSSSDSDDCTRSILHDLFVRNRQEEMDRAHELQKRNQLLQDAITASHARRKKKHKRKKRDKKEYYYYEKLL